MKAIFLLNVHDRSFTGKVFKKCTLFLFLFLTDDLSHQTNISLIKLVYSTFFLSTQMRNNSSRHYKK